MKKKYNKLLFFASIIWIASNFIHPVNPTFFTELNLDKHVFGTSYAAMVFAMFITSPFWGKFGDHKSRKYTLIIGTFFYGVSQIVYSFSTSVTHIILARFFSGSFSSAFMVGLLAMLVDISDDSNKATRIAKFSALLAIMSSIGFLIGGTLGYLPPRTVFRIQAAVMISISFLMYVFLDETNVYSKQSNTPTGLIKSIKELKEKKAFTTYAIIFALITFFIYLSYSGSNNAFNYYLKAELQYKPIFNGIWKAVIGISSLLANLTITMYLIRNADLKKSLAVILTVTAIASVVIFTTASIALFILSNYIFYISINVMLPILQSIALKDTKYGAGVITGIFSSIKSLGQMIGALLAGLSYSMNSKAPFIIASITIIVALLLSFAKQKENIFKA